MNTTKLSFVLVESFFIFFVIKKSFIIFFFLFVFLLKKVVHYWFRRAVQLSRLRIFRILFLTIGSLKKQDFESHLGTRTYRDFTLDNCKIIVYNTIHDSICYYFKIKQGKYDKSTTQIKLNIFLFLLVIWFFSPKVYLSHKTCLGLNNNLKIFTCIYFC